MIVWFVQLRILYLERACERTALTMGTQAIKSVDLCQCMIRYLYKHVHDENLELYQDGE